LVALQQQDKNACQRLLNAAGGGWPPTAGSLAALCSRYAELDMPLTKDGVVRFKAARGLSGGLSMAGTTAAAYARALEGREVLFHIDRAEESRLRPSERGALEFLRGYAAQRGHPAIRTLKRALQLGNPPLSDEAETLDNEYIGLATIEAVAHETAARGLPLSHAGMVELLARLPPAAPAPPKRRR
jgi:hypothetical protein